MSIYPTVWDGLAIRSPMKKLPFKGNMPNGESCDGMLYVKSPIDDDGKFVPDVILIDEETSFHILNYNSPGATGALPFSAYVVNHLNKTGLLKNEESDAQCGPWKFSEIMEKLEN